MDTKIGCQNKNKNAGDDQKIGRPGIAENQAGFWDILKLKQHKANSQKEKRKTKAFASQGFRTKKSQTNYCKNSG